MPPDERADEPGTGTVGSMRISPRSVRTGPLVLAAATAAAVVATLRRRQAATDADTLWREATSDASR